MVLNDTLKVESLQPKVSVAMLTYNHERFIAQALDSVLMQEVDFLIEIVIGDDCSTDDTRAILCAYQAMYPQKIQLLLWEENLGREGKNNLIQTLKSCQGEFVAFLEGDDYWIDKSKLQRQIGFLEMHPECVMCAHNNLIILETEKNIIGLRKPPRTKQFFDLPDVLSDYPWHTSSVIVRNEVTNHLPDWYIRAPAGDWPLYILAAQQGRIGYIDEVMSVYRSNSGGVWGSKLQSERYRYAVRNIAEMFANVDSQYHRYLYNFLEKNFSIAGQKFIEQENCKNASQNELLEDAIAYLDSLLGEVNIPHREVFRLRRRFFASYYLYLGYFFYKNEQLASASRNMAKAIYFEPSRLKDRGVISILGNSILGKNLYKLLKNSIKSTSN